MADKHPPTQNRPEKAPDPARSYERARPEDEAGMGRLDNNPAVPADARDKMDDAVPNEQAPKGVSAEDITDARQKSDMPAPDQPDHSMHEEEPLGWDQAPTDIHDPRQKRHPRKEGKGGVE